MKTQLAAALVTGLLASAAHADPIAVVNASSVPVTFAEYSSPTTVGRGLVSSNTLYFIDEKQVGATKAWYVFFEPVLGTGLNATITFDAPILSVASTKAALDGGNATYGANGINYGTSTYIGLEDSGQDSYSINGNQLTIAWHAEVPGDHIRVITSAVPEPSTQALLLAGMLAVGFLVRKRIIG